jgi:FixJ family two-component response regulator
LATRLRPRPRAHHPVGGPLDGVATSRCVDDDESVRESLPDLLGALGFAAQAFESAEALLASDAVLQEESGLQALRERYRALSQREREAMALVVRAQLNKQVGGDLTFFVLVRLSVRLWPAR